MVGDLFFLHLKREKSIDFEHKRGVPGNRKTENFGCFMAFSRSLNSPNGEFKTKKHPIFRAISIHKSLYINELEQNIEECFPIEKHPMQNKQFCKKQLSIPEYYS